MKDEIIFRQLSSSEAISDNNSRIISDLVYQTDEYIYPYLFGSIDNARQIISECLKSGRDPMFNTRNLYVAEQEGAVIGIVLWIKGPLRWTSTILRSYFTDLSLQAPSSIEAVCEGYFSSYSDADPDRISIINVCVAEPFRSQHVGSRMMASFIESHQEILMELYVLEENKRAIRMYEHSGFVYLETVNGFSGDSRPLPCLVMVHSGAVSDKTDRFVINHSPAIEYLQKKMESYDSYKAAFELNNPKEPDLPFGDEQEDVYR